MNNLIFDTLLDPVFIINHELQIIYCNESAANLTGISIRRILKSNPKMTEQFQFQPFVSYFDRLQQITDATPYFETSFTTNNETNGQVQITIQAYAENEWLIYFRDVTLETRLQNKYRQELDGKEKVIVELQQAKSQLEDYAQNLEQKVTERTVEISKLNHMLQALLDSLHQGFFIINEDGSCLPVYSRACQATLETTPMNKTYWEILKYDESKTTQLKKWLTTVFAEMLPFEDLAPLGPQWYQHSENKKIHLEYFPLRDENNLIKGIVTVATDLTRLIQAELTAEQQKQKAQFILHFVKNSESVYQFLNSAQSMIEKIIKLSSRWDEQNKDELFRLLHTLKGGTALFYLYEFSQEIHHCEELLLERKVDLICQKHQELDKKLKLLTEELHEQFGHFHKSDPHGIYITEKILQQLVQIIPPKHPLLNELEKHMEKELIGFHFRSYENLIEQLCTELGKSSAPMKINDHHIAYSELLNPLFQSFIHLFRNYVDHGIESPEERKLKNKPQHGQIDIQVNLNQAATLVIEIADDGAGISAEKIKKKLLEKNIQHDTTSEHATIQAIFLPEFSTKNEINHLSGRGVGLDAVAHEVKNLDGKIEVFSKLNQGTRFVIEIPDYEAKSKNKIAA